MHRYYFAWIGRRSFRVTRDGVVISRSIDNGVKVDRWALVYGANARQARHDFVNGNVSHWEERKSGPPVGDLPSMTCI